MTTVVPRQWARWLERAPYPPAVVVGLGVTGLALARPLARHGVPVIGVDQARRRFTGYSGSHRLLITDRFGEDEGFVGFLDALAEELPRRAVLLLSMDQHVTAIGRFGQHLRDRYRFEFPSSEVVELLMNKGRFAEYARSHGLPIPATHAFGSAGELSAIVPSLRFPVVLKPQIKNAALRSYCPQKVFRCEDQGQLGASYGLMSQWQTEGVVQEWIPGGDGEIFFSMHYLDEALNEVAGFEGRKIRQHVPQCGSTASAVGVSENRVSDLTREILRDVRCVGFGAVEYKRDPRNGAFYIMEPTVGRVDLQVGVAAANHYGFVTRAFFHLIGKIHPQDPPPPRRGVWLDLPRDLKTARQEVRRGELTWPGYFRSLQGSREFAVWRWGDLPLLWAYVRWIASLPFKLVRRMVGRLGRSLKGRLERLRAAPVLWPEARSVAFRDHRGLRPSSNKDHREHLEAAISWLVRSQDATPDEGFSRAYSLNRNSSLNAQGWQPSYPESTGYIIPTFYLASRILEREELARRACAAALWEIDVQLDSGAVQAGVLGEVLAPAVFNTGQVILGWLSALEATGDDRFRDAIERAGAFMVQALGEEEHWIRWNSPLANTAATLYNARAAWALAEAGKRLGRGPFTDSAARNLRAVARVQDESGWFPGCCLSDPVRPLVHTQAYTIRGLLEGARVLEDESLLSSASHGAEGLARVVRPDGWMAGRHEAGWKDAVDWSCLTGQAQMANVWLRLFFITGDKHWLEPVGAVLSFLKSTQNLESQIEGVHGGVQGSYPVWGSYGRYEIQSWATKFFADALMREELSRRGSEEGLRADQGLA